MKLTRRRPLIVQWTSGRDALCNTRVDFEIAPVRRPVPLLLCLPRFRRGSGGEYYAIVSGPHCGQSIDTRENRSLRCPHLFVTLLISVSAQAVVIRGRLTDALGKPVPRGMVRLVQEGKTVAFAYAETDGSFEIRSSESGRFTLLGSAGGFLPAIGVDFYGGVNRCARSRKLCLRRIPCARRLRSARRAFLRRCRSSRRR